MAFFPDGERSYHAVMAQCPAPNTRKTTSLQKGIHPIIKGGDGCRIRVGRRIGLLITLFSTVVAGQVPQPVRASIDRILSTQGTYSQDDQVYKTIFPREESTIVYDYQTLSPNLGLNSWAAFKLGANNQALLTGQLLLLSDEVDSVMSAALEAKLDVTGLASSSVFDGPRLQTLDVTATGAFQDLAARFRKCLDEIRAVRKAKGRVTETAPNVPVESSINAAPLDVILSMKGTVIGGAYRAAIGANAFLLGEPVGRDMGMSTWVSIAGTNNRAVAHGEFLASQDNLQKLLRALSLKGISVISIRNHTVGELPQFVFVLFRAEGTASDVARAIRYSLDAQFETKEISALTPVTYVCFPS
jgi:hypothetical protein